MSGLYICIWYFPKGIFRVCAATYVNVCQSSHQLLIVPIAVSEV